LFASLTLWLAVVASKNISNLRIMRQQIEPRSSRAIKLQIERPTNSIN
jgi:hypothetical protein